MGFNLAFKGLNIHTVLAQLAVFSFCGGLDCNGPYFSVCG
jgi:hypothetical protein